MFRYFFLLSLFCLFVSCAKEQENSEQKPIVLVTCSPYDSFVKEIGGTSIEVITLLPPGANLHIYEPTPQQMNQGMQAAVWFQIQEPFEKKISQSFLEKNPSQKQINLQKDLPLQSDPSTLELTVCRGHHHDQDLHTWLSPKFAKAQGELISKTLSLLFPKNAPFYEKNFKSFATRIDRLDQTIANQLAPSKGDAILVSHPAFGYFCADYGLLQLAVECEGKEPRPKDIEQIYAKAKSFTTRCALLQEGFNNQGAKIIADKLGIKAFVVDPFDPDYENNLLTISKEIAQ